MKVLMRYLCQVYQSRFQEDGWRTYVSRGNGALTLIDSGRHEGHKVFIADPFLFHCQESNWLFYETVGDDWKGKIGCFKEVAGKWVNQGVVLEQPWHMSYPQVFEENGHVYMIPEQSNLGKGDVSLYEAIEFPMKWRKVQTLIDRPFADATLLRRDGYYYLACYTIPPRESAELWYSTSLLGPWSRHPQWNHINQSARLRRCGGSFLERDGHLYRVAQDCNGGYGKRLFLVPVLDISPTAYREGSAELFLDKRTFPFAGKHTYNEIVVDGRRLSVFDCHYAYRLPIHKLARVFAAVLWRKLKRK